MKHQLPGLHSVSKNGADALEGAFLARVDHASYRRHPQKPFVAIRFSILEPKEHAGQIISGRLYCTPKALWRLNWFLRDFGYDRDLFGRDELDEKALLGLTGVVRTYRKTLNGHSFQNLEAFASVGEWDEFALAPVGKDGREEHVDDL